MANNKPATFVDMYWDEVRRYARLSGEGSERLSIQFIRSDPLFKYYYRSLSSQRRARRPDRSPSGKFAQALVFFGYRSNEDWWDVGETPKVKAGTLVRETARETPTTHVPESREVREERRVRSERQRERDELEAERATVRAYLDWLERQPPPRSGLKLVRENLRAIERRLGEL